MHDLQLRAMNRGVREEISALLCRVTEVGGEAGGSAINRCIRVQIMVNIHNPILRWTNVSLGGVSGKVFFLYEKLADFCYYYGRLDHTEKNCDFTHPKGMRYYGPWLRAYSQHPITMKEIIKDLN